MVQRKLSTKEKLAAQRATGITVQQSAQRGGRATNVSRLQEVAIAQNRNVDKNLDDLSKDFGALAPLSKSGVVSGQDKLAKQKFTEEIEKLRKQPSFDPTKIKRGGRVSDIQAFQRAKIFGDPSIVAPQIDLGTPGNLRAGQSIDPDTGEIREGTVGGPTGPEFRGGVRVAGEKTGGRVTPAGRPTSAVEAEKFASAAGKAGFDNKQIQDEIMRRYGIVGGKAMVDLKRIGIKFNEDTGKYSDKANRRYSNSEYGKTRYIHHYEKSASGALVPIYKWKPTLTRTATSQKLGGISGGAVFDENGVDVSAPEKTVLYRDDSGNLIEETQAPAYTEKGKQQRRNREEAKQTFAQTKGEYQKFRNEGGNLFDWMADGKSEEEWDKLGSSTGLGGGDVKLEDRDDKFWEDQLLNSQNDTEMIKLRRERKQAESKIEAAIESEIERKISNMQALTPQLKKELEAQVRDKVMKGPLGVQLSETKSQYDDIQSDYITDKVPQAKEEWARMAASTEKEKKQIKAEEELNTEMDKVRAELATKYPDEQFPETQIESAARANLNKDPFTQKRNNRISDDFMNGKIEKGNEIAATLSQFEGNIEDARAFWNNYLPTKELTEQLGAISLAQGYSVSATTSKLARSDVVGLYGKIADDTITEDDQIRLNDYKTDKPKDYYVATLISQAKENGLEWGPIEIGQWEKQYDNKIKRDGDTDIVASLKQSDYPKYSLYEAKFISNKKAIMDGGIDIITSGIPEIGKDGLPVMFQQVGGPATQKGVTFPLSQQPFMYARYIQELEKQRGEERVDRKETVTTPGVDKSVDDILDEIGL